MLITSDLIRGHTETIILAQLMPRDSYGYEINKAIHEKTGGRYELKEATLYSAFRRLENAQLIRSYWGDENTGARRQYYAITETIRRSGVEQWQKLFVNLRSSCITDFVERGCTEKALNSMFGNSAAIRRLHYVQFRKERACKDAPR